MTKSNSCWTQLTDVLYGGKWGSHPIRTRNKGRSIFADTALPARHYPSPPHPFKVGMTWTSVKNRATRELLVQKVQKALQEWNCTEKIALAVILSLTHNRRCNKNQERNASIEANGGVVKRGRPPTHGKYCGRKKTTETSNSM